MIILAEKQNHGTECDTVWKISLAVVKKAQGTLEIDYWQRAAGLSRVDKVRHERVFSVCNTDP